MTYLPQLLLLGQYVWSQQNSQGIPKGKNKHHLMRQNKDQNQSEI